MLTVPVLIKGRFNQKIYDVMIDISPAGSKEYIDQNNLFIKSGIKLSYQNYKHPTYSQLYGDFIPYMSVIDLLFNEGKKSLELIKSG